MRVDQEAHLRLIAELVIAQGHVVPGAFIHETFLPIAHLLPDAPHQEAPDLVIP